MPVPTDAAAPVGMAPPRRPPLTEEERRRLAAAGALISDGGLGPLPPTLMPPSARPPAATDPLTARLGPAPAPPAPTPPAAAAAGPAAPPLPVPEWRPPSSPDSSFSPLPGGGYATASAPWGGASVTMPSPGSPVASTPAYAPQGQAPGLGLDTARSFFGTPPDIRSFMRYDHRGPNTGAASVDPSFSSAMAAYNQGLNAILNRTSAQEQTGLGTLELLGVPGEGGVPGSLATRARTAEATDRSATSQYGPEAQNATSYETFVASPANAGRPRDEVNRAWIATGAPLPRHVGGPGVGGATPPLPGGAATPPRRTGPESPEAMAARIRNVLQSSRQLPASFVFGSGGPGFHTTATGVAGHRGRRREQLLRDAGVPADIIRQLANTNLLATADSSTGILPSLDELWGAQGQDPGVDIDLLMRRLEEIQRRAAARPSPIAP
jgi:hypothetical protein